MRLNKKAVAILLISTIAFFISVLIFSQLTVKTKAGPKIGYLGEIQLELFDYYSEGEYVLLYLDLAAKYAAESITITSGMTDKEYIDKFNSVFSQYLKKFNTMFADRYYKPDSKNMLQMKDYKVRIDNNLLVLHTDKKIEIRPRQMPAHVAKMTTYKVNPVLKVKLDGLKKLKRSGAASGLIPLR